MKSREALVRLRRFELDEKRGKVAALEGMIGDFKQMAEDLDRQIGVEQERAGVSDVNHYAYPTFAKAAIQRRNNLLVSASDLEVKLAEARDTLAEAFDDLKKIELLEERDAERARMEGERVARTEMDRIGAEQHRRAS